MLYILPDFRKIIEEVRRLPVKLSRLGYTERVAYLYTQIVLFLKGRWVFYAVMLALYPKLRRYGAKNGYTARFIEPHTRFTLHKNPYNKFYNKCRNPRDGTLPEHYAYSPFCTEFALDGGYCRNARCVEKAECQECCGCDR